MLRNVILLHNVMLLRNILLLHNVMLLRNILLLPDVSFGMEEPLRPWWDRVEDRLHGFAHRSRLRS